MRVFIRLLAVQFLASMVFVFLFRDDAVQAITGLAQTMPTSALFFLSRAWWVLLIFAAMFFFAPRKDLLKRLPMAFAAVMACNLLAVTFSLVKTSLPFIFPFWADPIIADLDQWLHFGVDPWQLAHQMSQFVPPDLAQAFYSEAWLVPAMYFPVFLALFDTDQKRVNQYMIVYISVWMVLGNITAAIFMSAGPVFYDQIYGGDRFAELHLALKATGLADGTTGVIQAYLWDVYANAGQKVGSGISAFPSVHVAMACLMSIYVMDRVRALWPLAVMITGTYLFLSVYLGWHYAVDGYFSILFVGAFVYALRRNSTPQATLKTA